MTTGTGGAPAPGAGEPGGAPTLGASKGPGYSIPALPWLGQMPLVWDWLWNPQRTIIPLQPNVSVSQTPQQVFIPPLPYGFPYTPGTGTATGSTPTNGASRYDEKDEDGKNSDG